MKPPYTPGNRVRVLMQDGSACSAPGTVLTCTMIDRPGKRPEWRIRVRVWSASDQAYKHWFYTVNNFGTSDYVDRTPHRRTDAALICSAPQPQDGELMCKCGPPEYYTIRRSAQAYGLIRDSRFQGAAPTQADLKRELAPLAAAVVAAAREATGTDAEYMWEEARFEYHGDTVGSEEPDCPWQEISIHPASQREIQRAERLLFQRLPPADEEDVPCVREYVDILAGLFHLSRFVFGDGDAVRQQACGL